MLSRLVLYDILPAYRVRQVRPDVRISRVTIVQERISFYFFILFFFFTMLTLIFPRARARVHARRIFEYYRYISLHPTRTFSIHSHRVSIFRFLFMPTCRPLPISLSSPFLSHVRSAHASPFLKVRSLCLRPRCVRRRINNLRLATVKSHGSHAICRPEEFARGESPVDACVQEFERLVRTICD